VTVTRSHRAKIKYYIVVLTETMEYFVVSQHSTCFAVIQILTPQLGHMLKYKFVYFVNKNTSQVPVFGKKN